MSEISFIYEGRTIVVQGNRNQKMKDICKSFLTKAQLQDNSVYYLYNGKKIKEELELENIMSTEDKNRNKMTIIVYNLIEEGNDNNNGNNNDIIVKSKVVICPECKEKIIIKINDYLISLYGCSKGHNFKNLFLDQYEKTQKVNLSQLICFNHKEKNKGNTYKNLLYRCISCEKNFCSICKDNHDKTHNIGNYDEKEYKCIKHDETFIKYCKDCKKNLCYKCKNEHKKHDIVSFEDIEPDLDEKKEELKKLRNLIDNLNIDV